MASKEMSLRSFEGWIAHWKPKFVQGRTIAIVQTGQNLIRAGIISCENSESLLWLKLSPAASEQPFVAGLVKGAQVVTEDFIRSLEINPDIEPVMLLDAVNRKIESGVITSKHLNSFE